MRPHVQLRPADFTTSGPGGASKWLCAILSMRIHARVADWQSLRRDHRDERRDRHRHADQPISRDPQRKTEDRRHRCDGAPIVVWHKMGHSPEEIADNFGHISLAQVYAALAYYHLNQQEIEADLAQEDGQTVALEEQAR